MKIFVSQIYIEVGANFPFTHLFQLYFSEELTKHISPSEQFCAKYGSDWKLMFRMSAKHTINQNEIRGPTVYKQDKDIEYSIFLPFDVIKKSPTPLKLALEYLVDGMAKVLQSLNVSPEKLELSRKQLIKTVLNDSSMTEEMYR